MTHFQRIVYQEDGDWNICEYQQGVSPLLFHKGRDLNDNYFFFNKDNSEIKGEIFKVGWKALVLEKTTRWLEKSRKWLWKFSIMGHTTITGFDSYKVFFSFVLTLCFPDLCWKPAERENFLNANR